MSIIAKLQVFKKECFEELNKKEAELNSLKNRLDYLTEQVRKEILSESERIDKRMHTLANEEKRINHHIDDVIDYLEELSEYGKEPKIVDAYINACYALDEKLAKYFEKTCRPNTKAPEVIRAYKRENRSYLQRIKELEYQISELWAKDVDTSEKEDFEYLDDDEARVRYYLTSSEYQSLTESGRNQRALDIYLQKRHSEAHIGKMYERYIGYLYEKDGYKVEYRGIEMGLKDGGIDLICRRQGEILLVQCKCWKQESTIYEKHICQLYGASKFYDKEKIQEEYSDGLFANIEWDRVTPVFVYTNQLDDHAIDVAKSLGVVVRNIFFDKSYPMIKCNINNGEKIYHLPIDQMYDQTKICYKGECYVRTVKEAENLGFRRAKRHMQNN